MWYVLELYSHDAEHLMYNTCMNLIRRRIEGSRFHGSTVNGVSLWSFLFYQLPHYFMFSLCHALMKMALCFVKMIRCRYFFFSLQSLVTCILARQSNKLITANSEF